MVPVALTTVVVAFPSVVFAVSFPVAFVEVPLVPFDVLNGFVYEIIVVVAVPLCVVDELVVVLGVVVPL